MSEKVLGFYEKDAKVYGRTETVPSRVISFYQRIYKIQKSKLVPVWRKSESVTVDWLEGFCKKRFSGCNQDINDLLYAVKKEVKKE